MRDELRAVLAEIRGAPSDPGLGLGGIPLTPKRPSLEQRAKLWDLAIKLGKVLGDEIDPAGDVGAADPGPSSGPRGRRARVDFGPD